jgi:NADH:ubiquinone oxidoreductase subunit 5 (subunit L)/multisubunit Na+/H+ antiporter MnhA subunit/multisubunit Na+/H+ antiporter MnhB subunit
MNLLLIAAVPFFVAALLAIPQFARIIPKSARAWITAVIMLMLFLGLASYYPQLQELDSAYKQAYGISDSSHAEESTEAETTEPASAESEESEEKVLPSRAITEQIEWVPELGLSISFYLDGLALMFGLIITGIGAGIALFAGYYFDDDQEQIRFLWMLFAFAGAMLGVVLSGNLITLFILWELTSITSFLLIGFKGMKYEDARFGALQALVVTGVGALGLIAGAVLLAIISRDVLGSTELMFEIKDILNADPAAIAAHPLYTAALLLIALGAFTKSAQAPFHFWLPGAMAAPTPASAYLHSATMVKAGIYLLFRLYPAMHLGELWTPLLVTVGIGTMFIGALFALGQRDLKAMLAYSTISWLGALVGMIGLPDYVGLKAAATGIIAHALYKAALFLAAGTIDHNTGTRIIDELGGLRKQMPIIAAVVVVSALSMAGLPIFFGFVAKEVLLDVWSHAEFGGQQLSYIIILISAALTGTVAFILIWDVFFRKPQHEIHYHASPLPLAVAPIVLAIGTTIFGLMLDPPLAVVEGMIALNTPKAINIHLLPASLDNPIFLTSMGIVASGFVFFLIRGFWLPIMTRLPLPTASSIFQGIIRIFDHVGDFALRFQNGQVRYYVAIILGTVSLVILSSGLLGDLAVGQPIVINASEINASTILRIVLLLLSITSAVATIMVRAHIHAALSLGVMGYVIGVLILVEPAPDVSLVQFLMETLGTILIIVMLSRISSQQRRDAVAKLWIGTAQPGGIHIGLIRDILIAGAVGVSVFFFTLTALVNRPERESITVYHLENTYEEIGVTDVVGAIVADWRGMDTVIEVMVFSVAGMGVLTLLTRGLSMSSPLTPRKDKVAIQQEFSEEAQEDVRDTTSLNTPFTQIVAKIELVLGFVIALSHIINGGNGAGDGFTAGAVAGLVTSLWYVIFGYQEAKKRLHLFAPHRLIRAGMLLILGNAILPIIFGLKSGDFLVHVDYGKLLGIADFLHIFGLELSSGLFYETGIALAVFGSIGAIMEAIAHPKETLDFDQNRSVTETH